MVKEKGRAMSCVDFFVRGWEHGVSMNNASVSGAVVEKDLQ